MTLPRELSYQQFRDMHGRPLPFWRPVLEAIRSRHRLAASEWRRAPLGRNVVFLLGHELVVKLVPPIWYAQGLREEAALELVTGGLPVRTPTLIAAGELTGWRYLVMTFLDGRTLDWQWSKLAASERLSLARQSGALAARMHALSLTDEAVAALTFDWSALLTEQRAAAAGDFADGGLAPDLIATFPGYQAGAGDLATPPYVLLHGDLSAINMVVEGSGTAMTVTGLMDFGDARLGPFEHDFISPVMHFFRGEPEVLAAFYRGYGLGRQERSSHLEHRLMARAALYYAELLEGYRRRLPTPPRPTWPDLAAAFWRLAVA